jgi:glutaredoxin 3
MPTKAMDNGRKFFTVERAAVLTKHPAAVEIYSLMGKNCTTTVDAGKGVGLILIVTTDITLYSRAWCSWCIDAKEYLTEHGFQFTEIDVGRDREAYEEMRELSDQTYVPTLVAGDEVLANFDTDQLQAFLDKHGIEP